MLSDSPMNKRALLKKIVAKLTSELEVYFRAAQASRAGIRERTVRRACQIGRASCRERV